MVTPAVPGQDPLETEVEQPLHRTDLLGPGVPARVPERDEPVSPLRPGQVVAGEEELVPVEEHGVAPRVAGRRDREEVFYPPLAPTDAAVPAVALVQAYRGAGLGGTWSSSGKRAAFVGSFSR